MNTNSAFNRTSRNEPFGFTFEELPKEMNNIDVTHNYNLQLLEYDDSVILEYLSKHV